MAKPNLLPCQLVLNIISTNSLCSKSKSLSWASTSLTATKNTPNMPSPAQIINSKNLLFSDKCLRMMDHIRKLFLLRNIQIDSWGSQHPNKIAGKKWKITDWTRLLPNIKIFRKNIKKFLGEKITFVRQSLMKTSTNAFQRSKIFIALRRKWPESRHNTSLINGKNDLLNNPRNYWWTSKIVFLIKMKAKIQSSVKNMSITRRKTKYRLLGLLSYFQE